MPELGKATYFLVLDSAAFNAGMTKAEERAAAATEGIGKSLGAVQTSAERTGQVVMDSGTSTATGFAKMGEGAQAAAGEAKAGSAEISAAAEGAAVKVNTAAASTETAWGKMGKSIGATSTKAFGGVKLLGLLAAYGVIKSGIDWIKTSNKYLLQYNAALKATHDVSGQTAQAMERFNNSNIAAANGGKAAVSQMQSILLGFTMIRNEAGKGNKIYDRTRLAILNIHAATGRGLNTIAISLGKALQDPTKYLNTLGRAGVTFSKQLQDQIKNLIANGHQLQARKLILDNLSRFTGRAAAQEKSFGGQLDIAKKKLEESSATIVTAFIPAFTAIVQALTGVAAFLSRHTTAVRRIIIAYVVWKAAIIGIGVAMKTWKALEFLGGIFMGIGKGIQWTLVKLGLLKTEIETMPVEVAPATTATATEVETIGTAAEGATTQVGFLRGALLSLGGAGVLGAIATVGTALAAAFGPVLVALPDMLKVLEGKNPFSSRTAGLSSAAAALLSPSGPGGKGISVAAGKMLSKPNARDAAIAQRFGYATPQAVIGAAANNQITSAQFNKFAQQLLTSDPALAKALFGHALGAGDFSTSGAKWSTATRPGMSAFPGTGGTGFASPLPKNASTTAIIKYWAQKYGINPLGAVADSYAESGLGAHAYNKKSGATGLFQFLPSTWAGVTRQMFGHSLPFSDAMNPMINAQVAMWSIAQNGLGRSANPQQAANSIIHGFEKPGAAGEAYDRAQAAKYLSGGGSGASSPYTPYSTAPAPPKPLTGKLKILGAPWINLENNLYKAQISNNKKSIKTALDAERDYLNNLIKVKHLRGQNLTVALAALKSVNSQLNTLAKAVAAAGGLTGLNKLLGPNWVKLDIQLQGALQTKTLADDRKVLQAQIDFLKGVLKNRKLTLSQTDQVKKELTRVMAALSRDNKDILSLAQQSAQELAAFQGLQGSFFGQFAPNIFTAGPAGLTPGTNFVPESRPVPSVRPHAAGGVVHHYATGGPVTNHYHSGAGWGSDSHRYHRAARRYFEHHSPARESRGPDTIPAMLSEGEIILNARQQRQLRSKMGLPAGGSPSQLFSAITGSSAPTGALTLQVGHHSISAQRGTTRAPSRPNIDSWLDQFSGLSTSQRGAAGDWWATNWHQVARGYYTGGIATTRHTVNDRPLPRHVKPIPLSIFHNTSPSQRLARYGFLRSATTSRNVERTNRSAHIARLAQHVTYGHSVTPQFVQHLQRMNRHDPYFQRDLNAEIHRQTQAYEARVASSPAGIFGNLVVGMSPLGLLQMGGQGLIDLHHGKLGSAALNLASVLPVGRAFRESSELLRGIERAGAASASKQYELRALRGDFGSRLQLKAQIGFKYAQQLNRQYAKELHQAQIAMHHGTALDTHTAQIATEFEPHFGIYPGDHAAYNMLGWIGKNRYARQVKRAGMPRIQRLAEELGLSITGTHSGKGIWRGRMNPGMGIHVHIPPAGWTPAFQAKMEALASGVGETFMQGSVSFGRPTFGSEGTDAVLMKLLRTKEGTYNPAKLQSVLDKRFGEGLIGVTHSPEKGSYYLQNFGLPSKKFHNALGSIGIKGRRLGWQGGYVYDHRLAEYGAPGVKTFRDSLAHGRAGLSHMHPLEQLSQGQFVDSISRRDALLAALPQRFDALAAARATIAAGHKLPPHLMNEQTLAEKFIEMHVLAKHGILYKDFYTRSALVAKRTGRLTGTPASKVIQLLALYSQRARPTDAFKMAMDTMLEHASGMPLTAKRITAEHGLRKAGDIMAGKSIEEVFGPMWKKSGALNPSSQKIRRFAANMLQDINPALYKKWFGEQQFSTMDMHATNAIDRTLKGEPGAYYRGFETLYAELGAQMGMTAKEAQAAVWAPTKAMAEREHVISRGMVPKGDWKMFMERAGDAHERGFRAHFGDAEYHKLMLEFRRKNLETFGYDFKSRLGGAQDARSSGGAARIAQRVKENLLVNMGINNPSKGTLGGDMMHIKEMFQHNEGDFPYPYNTLVGMRFQKGRASDEYRAVSEMVYELINHVHGIPKDFNEHFGKVIAAPLKDKGESLLGKTILGQSFPFVNHPYTRPGVVGFLEKLGPVHGAQVLIHEIGHALDVSALKNSIGSMHPGSVLAGKARNETPYKELMKALYESPTGKEIRLGLANNSRYLADPQEMFARAYTQWIRTKLGHEALINATKHHQALWDWKPDEFGPISEKMDELFRSKGMLRFASGGTVGGKGHGDTIAAMLSPGEIVLNNTQQGLLKRRMGLSGGLTPSQLFGSVTAPLGATSAPPLIGRSAAEWLSQVLGLSKPQGDALAAALATQHFATGGVVGDASNPQLANLREWHQRRISRALGIAQVPNFVTHIGEGTTRTLHYEQNNSFHEIPKDRFALSRQMRIATEAMVS